MRRKNEVQKLKAKFRIKNWQKSSRLNSPNMGSAETKILGQFFQAKVVIQFCRARQKKTRARQKKTIQTFVCYVLRFVDRFVIIFTCMYIKIYQYHLLQFAVYLLIFPLTLLLIFLQTSFRGANFLERSFSPS